MDPFIGEIRIVGFNYAPYGWAFCNGQIVPIQQNTALFAVIGTMYGGNGTTNFALPDLRGKVPTGAGAGPGLTTRNIGNTGGAETATLNQNQMGSHTHSLRSMNSAGTDLPNLAVPGDISRGGSNSYSASNAVPMGAGMLDNTGGGQAHNNMMPFQAQNFVIAIAGIFPVRS